MSPEDRLTAAHAIAVENGWPEAEIDKLDRWRRAVVDQEQEEAD